VLWPRIYCLTCLFGCNTIKVICLFHLFGIWLSICVCILNGDTDKLTIHKVCSVVHSFTVYNKALFNTLILLWHNMGTCPYLKFPEFPSMISFMYVWGSLILRVGGAVDLISSSTLIFSLCYGCVLPRLWHASLLSHILVTPAKYSTQCSQICLGHPILHQFVFGCKFCICFQNLYTLNILLWPWQHRLLIHRPLMYAGHYVQQHVLCIMWCLCKRPAIQTENHTHRYAVGLHHMWCLTNVSCRIVTPHHRLVLALHSATVHWSDRVWVQ